MTIQYLNHEQLQFFYSQVREILDIEEDATADDLLDAIKKLQIDLHRHVYSSANDVQWEKPISRVTNTRIEGGDE